MRIQHNIAAMSSYRNYTNNVAAVNKNLEKLSSGYKINRAGDDAAGLAISEKMRAQISGLEAAQKNAKDGISLVQTAEGALTEVHDMLNRMVTLATQSANGTYDNDTDRFQLQKEMDQLKSEIDRIADSSNFNGIQLLNGDMDTTVKTTGNTNVALTPVADGQLGQTPQAGVYSVDFSKTTVQASDNKALLKLTIFGKEISTEIEKKGQQISGDEIAQAFADAWNDPKLGWADIFEVDYGVNINASVEGDRLVFTMDNAPTKAWDVASTTGQFTYDLTSGNNGEQITVTVEKEAVDSTMNRMYGQAKFTLTKDMITDGTTLTIGDETYAFALGASSKYKNVDNVIDLTDKTKTSKDLVETAAQRLSTAAKNNASFKVGTTLQDGTITITEKEGGVDYSKNNLAGADGKGSYGNGKALDATAADWAGLVKTGSINNSAMGSALLLQIGDTSDSYNQLRVSIKDCHISAMGLDGVSIATQDSAAAAIDKIKSAINYVSDVRGTLGATQNRLDHTINNLSVMTENIQDAESTIRDTDIAEEMMAYTKNNILVQSAQAMLAQANQIPQGVLQLLG